MRPLLLLYDDGCGFCRRCVRYLRERDLGHGIEPVPNQSPGLEARTGLTRAQLDGSVWLLEADGSRRAGAAALNRALRALGGPWWVAGTVGGLPGVAGLEQSAYGWVSGHRSLVSRVWADPPDPS